jgi:hypothetical protein
MPNKKYDIGDKVGRLTIIKYAGYDHANKLLVECKCDCGKLKITRINNIGRKTNSCGCYKAEMIKERMGKPIEHLATVSMLNACKGRKLGCDLSYEEIKKIIFSTCFYCEKTAEEVGGLYTRPIKDGRSVKRLGIDRVDNSKGYFRDNIVACCKECNYIKRDHDVSSLITRLEKFLINLKRLGFGNG